MAEEPKISVYIALGIVGALAVVDLIVNGTVEASTNIILGLLGFAGGRQLLKSTIGK